MDSPNPPKMAFTPLPIKKIESKKVDETNPRRGLDCISYNTLFKNSCASVGATDKKNEEKVSSIFATGINGMRFNTKIKNGNKAIKKLKAMLLALVVSVPLMIPKK
ncbi:MAG: Uncharacterised protein [Bacteroidota bacterium]|nr:MAG: Uncharacterised protein [Bacteroidota bacterium]